MKWGRYNQFSEDSTKILFLQKVQIGTSCWEWIGGRGAGGRYGVVGVRGKPWLAHRLSWLLFRGEDPGDMCVCHKCDNTFCVNPDHLFLGSQKDNVEDMENKQRAKHPFGAAHGRAKLTEEIVLKIRSLYPARSQRSLAKEFGVNKTSIKSIVTRTGWKHI